MRKIISVTQDHIDAGLRHDCQECPVGLALRDAFNAGEVIVDNDVITVQGHVLKIPVELSKRIVKFDQDEVMKPYSFSIEIGLNKEWEITRIGDIK